ncbi:MAG: ABC transporter ATP-binding protein [Burkholderiaceae bacterium]
MSLLSVTVRRKAFGDTLVLEDVEFDIEPGSFTALVGPSGAGKSTLLNIVSALDGHFEGRLDWSPQARRRIGYMFQEPRLMPWLNACENIELVLAGRAGASDIALSMLERVGLAGREGSLPRELSGGMQRRIALARAMAIEPDLLLLDEPFSSLDEPTAQGLRRLSLHLCREQGNAVLLVTHNLSEALSVADRVLFLSRGPARVVHRECLSHDDSAGARLRDPDPALRDLLARHPDILSGVVTQEETS